MSIQQDLVMYKKGYRYCLYPSKLEFEPIYVKNLDAANDVIDIYKGVVFSIRELS